MRGVLDSFMFLWQNLDSINHRVQIELAKDVAAIVVHLTHKDEVYSVLDHTKCILPWVPG